MWKRDGKLLVMGQVASPADCQACMGTYIIINYK